MRASPASPPRSASRPASTKGWSPSEDRLDPHQLHAVTIVKLVDESVEECRRFAAESASLVVGTLAYPPFEDLLLRTMAAFKDECPDKHVEILFASGTYANVESVQVGKVDLSLFAHLRSRLCSCDVEPLSLPTGVESFYLETGECLFWMNSTCPLFEKERICATDLEGYTLLLGNSQNMADAGRTVADYFARVGVAVEPDNQPCANYLDLYLSGLGETFGVALADARSGLRESPNIRIFRVEDFSVPCELHVLSDPSRLDACGLAFMERLRAAARAS